MEYVVGLHDKICSGSVFRLKRSSPLLQENDNGNDAHGVYYENKIQIRYSQNVKVHYSQQNQEMMDDDEVRNIHHIDQLQALQ